MNGLELAALLGAAAASVPRLPDAACRSETWMADVELRSSRDTIDAAVELCLSCPAMQRCAAWLDSLPPDQKPAGVVAGRLYVDPPAVVYARSVMAAELKSRRSQQLPLAGLGAAS
ncbi:hypothetical protein MYCODSM44623_01703 [Mycobacterium intracellulare subsp. chimaera]|uniref:hypothetical protein n=1 Tax=Mycobacterium intracellulare TaxID=1767 RepID=UPI000938CC3E|nr:hypothetical protein [Mycobacterium intracellulare]ASL08453.1 hypothetical protein MYCODSM44623_01703 [Mycobacterium intracellulare subsp. chimaera]MCV7324271.1 hypothetical protein [Mycobacterium intracellulare subsp. chimaera]ORV19981.1 hypothetical protein AWB97_24865 [Mycobacterium intracellulare subsp. chimaera]